MLSGKLENLKNSLSREQATLLVRVGDYLQSQLDHGIRDFQPKLIAAALDISEAQALLILVHLQRLGFLRVKYTATCPNSAVPVRIAYEKTDLLQDLAECEECGDFHEARDLKVKVSFEYVGSEPLIGHAA